MMGVAQVAKYQEGFLAAAMGAVYRYDSDGTPTSFVNGVAWMEYFRELGSDNPYNVESMWCVYIQEDDKVLIGGAIATDTTQPYLFRNLVRVLPDGSHDTTFPAVEIEQNNENTAIYAIHKDSEGRWLVSGDFHAINGHETAHIARLNPDFSVDTGFVSPLDYILSGPTSQIILLDSQDRMWLSGHKMILHDNPQNIINALRILPSGAVDSTFLPRKVEQVYSFPGNQTSYINGGFELVGTGHYILYGRFNYFNDTLQPCITVVDDAGNIQDNYFQSMGATELNYWSDNYDSPYVGAVEELPDGSLIVGGAFSTFTGTTHYNLIKLNRGTIGTTNRQNTRPLQVYPNPARDGFRVKIPGAQNAEISILDLSGREVYRTGLRGDQSRISTVGFSPGMYLVHVRDDEGTAVRKIVVE